MLGKVIAIGLLVIAGFSVAGYLVFSGPRMTVQPNLRTYDARMPLPPPGIVPVEALAEPRVPAASEARALVNPLPPGERNLAAGRVWYNMHCAFCHGGSGAGDGPVGRSFSPAPADLRSARIAAMSDGELLRAMLTGPGHEPVLERVVLPERRWPIVLHVRTLSAGAEIAPASGTSAASGAANP